MLRLSFLISAWIGYMSMLAHADEPAVDFDRDVKAMLSDHCFACHGPDVNQRQAGLRLDLRMAVFGELESGERAVVPGSAKASLALQRMLSQDPEQVMPPPTGKPLTRKQIDLFQRWIEQGAPWKEHWAFEPIAAPPVPNQGLAVGDVFNPIDAFVLEKLSSTSHKQSPMESRERLLRRVSLDLTGLPPTLQEIEQFLADNSDRAYETVVDRLLASKHFGERLALPWLDLARYGDTSGYHNDSLRDMWLWRQWVIDAFNKNMPFDQFTIEQLAGDLLPAATIDQRVASGFHRNVMTSDEGGLIDAEYRNLYIVDRIATTGVTWLGMTIACAQCHDHKYDPFTQKDYYRLYAFFNNVPENGKDGVRDRNPVPFLRVPTAEQSQQLADFDHRIAEMEKRLAEINQSLTEKQANWESRVLSGQFAAPTATIPNPIARFALDVDGSAETAADSPTITGTTHGTPTFEEGVRGKAFKASGAQWFEYPEAFNFEKDSAFSVSAFLAVSPEGGAPFGRMDDRHDARGWDIEFHGLRPSFHLISRWPENVIHVQAEMDLPANVFTHLAITYDGSGKASGVKMYVNGLLAPTRIAKDKLRNTIKSQTPFSIGRRGDASTPFHGLIDDVQVFGFRLSDDQVLAINGSDILALVKLPTDQRTAMQKEMIEKYFIQSEIPERASLVQSISETRKARDAFEAAVPNTMVMAEMDKPRETFIKVRGNYDQDGERVAAAVPSFLPQVAASFGDRPLNRLDLAQWLIHRDHPLTARVTVNRWWAMLFGNGLVKTLNDFGLQGERPSHPALLDWLANDLMRDWDTKRVIKQMVMSATYRQSARASSDLLRIDSDNRLLARGPRQRLDAEMIRDNALAIGGILNPKVGGQSIKPSQPDGTWEINEMSGYRYEKSSGADLYRRGLYVYWRRSTVYPSFVTLDAPTREFCVAQRAKTNTPLQSLVLMNDPVFVEAARAFAQRLLAEAGLDDEGRLRLAWRLALARTASDRELQILTQVLQEQQQRYQSDLEASQKLATVGDLAPVHGQSAADVATWTAVCNVLLNLNETLSN